MNYSKHANGSVTDAFVFDNDHCWLDLASVTHHLSSRADRELVKALAIAGRLPPADALLEQLREFLATAGLIAHRAEWLEVMALVTHQAACKCGRTHFTDFAARVEARIAELQPRHDRAFGIVEVSETNSIPDCAFPPGFVYYDPDLWTLLNHNPLESLHRVIFSYPGHGTTATLDLEGNGATRRLTLSIPADASRAELMYMHNDAGPAPDRTPMAEHLNHRPDADIDLLIAISDSAAPIVSRTTLYARPAYPAFVANLWDIDASVRVAGLYALSSGRRSAAVRLSQDWCHTLDDLRSIVETLTD